MSTFRDTARYVKELSDNEYLILKYVEKFSRRYERVSIRLLSTVTGFSLTYSLHLVKKLVKHGFLMYFEQPYESVMILTSGIDLIALKRLADKGIVVGIGRQIGVGKEADVYEAINDIGEKVSIKVFRLGRISFRGIARKRSYSVIKSSHKWLLRNYISAKKEYENLVVVYQRGISAPRPIYRTMHVLVMEYLDGFLLKDLQEVDDPYSLYANIINEIKKTWNLGYVNGDLSEYNIFILNESGRPVIIDWPQAIKRENPVSIELIKRDVSNITKFFIKRFDCEYNKLKKIIYSISLSFLE